MLALAFVRLALLPGPIVNLFGGAIEAAAKSYGPLKLSETSVEHYSRRSVYQGKFADGSVQITTRDGRISEIEFVFGRAAKIDYAAALERVGIPPKGIKSQDNGVRAFDEVTIQDWTLGGGALGKVRGTYTRNQAPNSSPEQILTLDSTSAVYFAPNPVERKAILDTLRTPVSKAFRGQRVEFIVPRITTARGWAFVFAIPQAPSGAKLDIRRSDFADQAAAGVWGNNAIALMRQSNGNWAVRELVIGATDVAWEGWNAKYQIPRLLFMDEIN